MATVAEYEAWKARQQQANVGKANIVLSQEWPSEPDQFAGELSFAKEASAVVGNPVPLQLIQDPSTRSVFERIVAEKKQSTILTQSPKLADWLRTPMNAALTRDDLEGLGWWETVAGAAGNAVQRGATRLPQMYNQWMAEGAAQRSTDADKTFADIYGQERATVGVEGQLIDTAVGPITDLWTAGSRFLTARLSQAFGGDQQQAAAYYQQQVGEISKQIAAIPMSPAASKVRDEIGALQPTGDIMSDVGNFLRVMGSDIPGFSAFIGETAAETAPSLAAAFGVGIATRNPGAAAATMGLTSGLQERFTSPADFLQQRGIDISTPEGAMAAVTDPALMGEAAKNGTIRGVIIGALDTISGGVAGETLARSPAMNLVLQSLIQSVFGGGGEAAAQVATGQQLNVADVMIEAMAEFVTAPLDVASMAATRFREGTAKSQAATATVDTLTEIASQATASVTRTRSPDVFRDFIKTVTANGGRENMFVPADAFTEYFQSRGIDPFELADQLAGMGRDDLQTAIETGGSVKIPTATWAADMAGSEHDQFVIQNSAFSPDDMTGMQAAEFEAVKNDLLAEAWAEAEAVRQDEDSLRAIYDQEREAIVSSLRSAGRATDVATAEAMPLVAFRRTMAERMGLTPEEFAGRYPLPEVRGERPEGLDPKNVDALTRTLAEARARRSVGLDAKQTPLLEFISERGGVDDPGGELAARDAAVVKRPGKKTLKLARSGVLAGMRDMLGGSADRGLDTTARAAVESGFMADDPDVLAWLEAERSGTAAPDLTAALLRAVDAEMRGETAAPVDDLGGVEEYLSGLGVGLDDSDADIRAAIEATQQYDKPARVDNSGTMLTRAQQKAEERIAEINRLNPQLSTPITIEWVDGSSDPTKPNAEGSHGGFKITISRKATNPDAIVIHELRHVIDSLLGLATLTRTIDFMKGDAEFDALIVYLKSARDDGRIPDDAYWIAADSEVAAETAGSVIAAYFNDRAGLQAVAPDLVELLDGMDAGKYAAVVEPMPAAIEGDGEGRAYGQSPQHLFTPTDTTQTPAFKAWFGDSKVVDAAGKPLVVYHGSPARGINQFKVQEDNYKTAGTGFWFTTDDKAATYSGEDGEVYPVYLQMSNPIVVNWDGHWADGPAAAHQEYRIKDQMGVEVLGRGYYEDRALAEAALARSGIDGLEIETTDISGEQTTDEWVRRLRRANPEADGIILRNVSGGGEYSAGFAGWVEGDEYVAFEPTQIKSQFNRGTFDATDPRILFQPDMGFNGAGGGARGSIQFPGAGVSNGQTIISLFQSADLSTFLHESGHYFLTVVQDMARLDPTGSAATEYKAIMSWMRDNADAVARDAGSEVTADDVRAALDNGTSGNAAKDRLIDTGMQEQFARATEQYLLEGKAPSQDLRAAFEKFHAWLLSIYKNLRGLNVNVTDELRGVFDRLLATDAEITAARADIDADVNLTADDLGMTAEQFDGFVKLRDQARDEASARTLAEAMMPIRRAATAAYKAERAKVRERIDTETKQQPVYRAIQELRFGKDFAGNDVEPLKLNRAMIEKDYGAGYVPFLPGATKDGSGHRNAVFSTEGGVHPDIAAGAYGFPTGRDMLDAMTNAPDMAALVEAETNKEMASRHNDPLKDGSIQQDAMDAVHNDLQGRVLAARLEAFNEIAGTDRGLSHKQAREAARRSLRGMAVKDATRADRFLAAERKAAGEVAKLTATVTRTSMWMDAARRRVEVQARGAVRAGDGRAALALAPKVDAANQSTQRYNEQAAALVEASRRQLLNHMLYSEARKVATETEQTVKRLSMLRKANARLAKTRDINFVLAARAVAGRFGLSRPDSAFDFNAWLEQLRFDDPVTASALVNSIDTYSQEAKPYKDLTVSEFGAVKDAIDSLLSLARTTRSLEIEGQKVDRREAIDAMIAVAEPRGKVRIGTNAAPTKREKNFLSSLTIGSALVRTEAWARDMDDGQAGVFTRYIVRPVMEALGEYRTDRTARMAELLAIVEPRRGELLGAAVNAPELGYTFENKGALLHALLHTGNESNKKKLLLGRGWSAGMVNAKQAVTKNGAPRKDRQGNPIMDKGVLDTVKWDAFVERMIAEGAITAADKRMVEQIWTLMDSMKRPAQTAHKKIYGHYFQEIEAAPFTNSLGVWRGGYVPAIIDQYASIDAGKQDAAAAMDSQMDASMFPTTGSGFTKGRVEYNQPLAMNLQSLPGHMDKVLRFTHLEPTIRQTASLLADRGLREAVSNVNRDAIDAILTPWLVRTARQAVETPSPSPQGRQFGNIMRSIRKRVGLHMMSLNIVNAAQQVTGIPTAMVLVKAKHMKGATVRFAKDARNMRAEAVANSAMMRDRMDNSSRVTAQEIDKIIIEPTIQAEVDRFVNTHGYILQQGTQNVVDVIVWHAGYDQAIASGMTDADAVFEADSVVRRTQGSFNPEDVSMFETGTAFQRVFTMFTSYFNTQLNLLGGEAVTAVRTMGWSSKSRLFHLYFFGMMIPAVVAEAISQGARGELGDEDDDGLLDDMLDLFVGSQVKFVTGAIPFLGPLTMAALNKFNDQPWDDKLSVSPAIYVGERVVGAPATVVDAFTGGSKAKAVADGLTALGLILGVPTGQLAKSAGYLVGVGEGKSDPQNAGDVMRGVMSGRDGTE